MIFKKDGIGYRLYKDKKLTEDGAVGEVSMVEITTYYQTSGQVESQRVIDLKEYPNLQEVIGEQIYAWETGINLPSGTPLTVLPEVDAFLQTKLISIGLTNVEQLEKAGPLDIARLGRGGIELVNSAKDYIKIHGAKDILPKVDEEKEQLKAQLAEMAELVKALTDKKKKEKGE